MSALSHCRRHARARLPSTLVLSSIPGRPSSFPLPARLRRAHERGAPGATGPRPRPARRTRGARGRGRSVVAISIDGLNPQRTDPARPGAPHLHRLIAHGATTLNARTEREIALTLPNHTGMVTGRASTPPPAATASPGTTTGSPPHTVQEAAGHDVASVFTVVDDAGASTALFASKTKFSLWQRSWPDAIDAQPSSRTTRAGPRFKRDLDAVPRDFRFLHLSAPDVAGHAHGCMSAPTCAPCAAPTPGRSRHRRAAHRPALAGRHHGPAHQRPRRPRATHDDPTSWQLPHRVHGPGRRRGPRASTSTTSTRTTRTPAPAARCTTAPAGAQRRCRQPRSRPAGPACGRGQRVRRRPGPRLSASAEPSGAPASQASGHGLNRHPPVPLDCCIITGAGPPRPGTSGVPMTEPVPGLVVDHEVAVVAQRPSRAAFHAGDACFQRSWLMITKRPTRHDQVDEQVGENVGIERPRPGRG